MENPNNNRRLFDDGTAVMCPDSGNIRIVGKQQPQTSISSAIASPSYVASPWKERSEGMSIDDSLQSQHSDSIPLTL